MSKKSVPFRDIAKQLSELIDNVNKTLKQVPKVIHPEPEEVKKKK